MTVNFQPVIKQFDKYLLAKCSDPPTLENLPIRVIRPAGCEAKNRLRQLDWLCWRIGKYEANSVEFLHSIISQANASEPDAQDYWAAIDANLENSFEMEILVEGFYYLAWRFSNVISDFPGLKKFKCEGVRDVRNHLIEHPERSDSGVAYGFMSSGNIEIGPILRWGRPPSDNAKWPDKGLWVNAREFEQNLTAKINAALSE